MNTVKAPRTAVMILGRVMFHHSACSYCARSSWASPMRITDRPDERCAAETWRSGYPTT